MNIHRTVKAWNQELYASTGRIFQREHINSNDSGSRKWNCSFRSPFFFGIGTKAPYLGSWNYVSIQHINTPAADRIYKRTSFPLLRERIHHDRKELDATSRDLLVIHLQLASTLSESDWNLIYRLSADKATRIGETNRFRQCRLHKTQNPRSELRGETVVNLRNKPLDDGLESALQKGLNFVTTHRVKPQNQNISKVEILVSRC